MIIGTVNILVCGIHLHVTTIDKGLIFHKLFYVTKNGDGNPIIFLWRFLLMP